MVCGFVDYFSKKKEQTLDKPMATEQTKYTSSEKSTKSLSKNVFESLQFEDKANKSPHDDYYEEYDNDIPDEDEDVEHSELGFDQEDDGSIHSYGPDVEPNNTLTGKRNNPITDSEEISHFSQTPFPTVTRKYPLDGKKLEEAPLPGPPRDLVAQIVNPRFVALSWMEPLKNPDEVISYTVYYKMTTSERYT